MPYHSQELVEVVRELVQQIAALRVEVAQLHRGQASVDHAALVEAASDAMGDRVFASAELLARSLRSDAPGMRLAALLAGRSVRAVGKLLAAAADKLTGEGSVLRRIGADRAGAIWCVSNLQTRSQHGVALGARS